MKNPRRSGALLQRKRRCRWRSLSKEWFWNLRQGCDKVAEVERFSIIGLTLGELLRAREDLTSEIVGKMPEKHRRFLISIKRGKVVDYVDQ
jgi:hypothetical protein